MIELVEWGLTQLPTQTASLDFGKNRGVRSKKNSGNGRSFLPSDPIEELRFSTDGLAER